MSIDTHVHVWQPGDGHRVLVRERIPALDKDFGFARLAPLLRPAGIRATVLVSAAQSFAETERLLHVAELFPAEVLAVIGFLDVHAPDFDDQLDRACRHPAFAGLRLPLVVFDDPDWIRHARVRHALETLGARGLVAQILAGPVHLSACADVLSEHPSLRVVIDHAGNPGPDLSLDGAWRDGLAAIGRDTTAICKLGEFSVAAGSRADPRRCDIIFGHVAGCFGMGRLVYGSNWPVSTLRMDYGECRPMLAETVLRAGLDLGQFMSTMTETAQRLYARPCRAGWP